MRCVVAVACLLGVSICVAPARTWLVRPDGVGDSSMIQAAVSAAANRDFVLLGSTVTRTATFRGLQ